jgi:dTDP-4-dehydrorhamnose 3,5-epimerase
MKNSYLDGIAIREISFLPDERGFFSEVFRKDWDDLFKEEVVQANLACNYAGVVKAWHRHNRGQTDYFHVLEGAIKICAFDEAGKGLSEIVASRDRPALVKIPGHYWHGLKVLGNTPALIVYFVTRLYDPKNPDEQRRPWDDKTIVPSSINGNANDPRVNKPWDWLYLPYK